MEVKNMADNLYKKIMNIRKDFSDETIKKTGKNEFQNFSYLELSDFIPTAVRLCEQYGVYTHVNIGSITNQKYATMTVVNVDDTEEKVVYSLQMPCLSNEGAFNNKIQDIGKTETYIRRYLYMLFLDIAIADEVDAVDNRPKRASRKR